MQRMTMKDLAKAGGIPSGAFGALGPKLLLICP